MIRQLVDSGLTKTAIAEEVGCTRKTLLKVLNYLDIVPKNIFDSKGTKECLECGKRKHKSEYYLINNKRYLGSCKDCKRKAERLKYAKRVNTLNQYKEKIGCAKCLDKRAYVLDFHHIDKSKKEYTIAKNPNISLKNPRFLEELAKCVLLCANCHREYHFLERSEGLKLEDYIVSENTSVPSDK